MLWVAKFAGQARGLARFAGQDRLVHIFIALIFIAQCSLVACTPAITLVDHPNSCFNGQYDDIRFAGLRLSDVKKRFLAYPDGSAHNVSLPYASWSSARIVAEIIYILLEEVMGYSVVSLSGVAINTGVSMAYLAGCVDIEKCVKINNANPTIHLSVETWTMGIATLQGLPYAYRPLLANVYDYKTVDQVFVWQSTVERGKKDKVFLDFYGYYNAGSYNPEQYFDSLDKLLALTPIGNIETCTNLDQGTYGNLRYKADYIKFTGNNQLDCYRDMVWFSPACRRRSNTSQCVPVMVQYEYHVMLQLSFFLDFPVALVKFRDGSSAFDQVYYDVVRGGNFVFGWFKPDDNLLATDNVPVRVRMPDPNGYEQAQGKYATGLVDMNPRNYMWRYLPSVDKHVSFLASKLDFFDQDVQEFMAQSNVLKTSGMPSREAMFQVACNWLKGNEQTWFPWIPSICPEGFYGDSTLLSCLSCPAGWFCPGGTANATICPVGFFCPENSTQAIQCPNKKITSMYGASSSHGCDTCPSNFVLMGNECEHISIFIVVVLIPFILLAVLLLMYFRKFQGRLQVQEDKDLIEMISDLRKRLHIQLKDGYALSTERLGMRMARSQLKVIAKRSMEAAARLSIFQDDFDEHFFDSFCMCLLQRGSEADVGDSEQYHNLCDWLLEQCRILLLHSNHTQDLERRLEQVGSTVPHWDSLLSSCMQRVLGWFMTGEQRNKLLQMRLEKIRNLSKEERYLFFKTKVTNIKLWKDDITLFRRLQLLAQQLMADLVKSCEQRFNEMVNKEHGAVLVVYAPHIPGVQSDVEGSRRSWQDYSSTFMEQNRHVTLSMERQDTVGAVRYGEREKSDARTDWEQMVKEGALECLDEEIFVVQLNTRSRILNDGFHRAVMDVLLSHCTGLDALTSSSSRETRPVEETVVHELRCIFREGPGNVKVHLARVKSVSRMREKLREYAPPNPKGTWPLCCNILDPVRLCLVCQGPSHMVQVAEWFEASSSSGPLTLCRVKNKFAWAEVEDGYRDLKLHLIYRGEGNLQIIGEIQIQDSQLYSLHTQMHRLYSIKRAYSIHYYLNSVFR